MLDTNHQLYKLAESVDWTLLEGKIVNILGHDHSSHWRLVTGSVYLSSFYDLSSTELMTLWSKCQHLRYFCCGELTNSGRTDFPLSQAELDNLSCELIGEGYDVMIEALRVQATGDKQHMAQASVH